MSRPKVEHVTTHLIVFRVKDRSPANQSDRFTIYRHGCETARHAAAPVT